MKEKLENVNILLNTIVERFFKLFDEIMESFCQKCDIEMPVQSDGTNKISFFVDFFTTQHKNHQNTEESFFKLFDEIMESFCQKKLNLMLRGHRQKIALSKTDILKPGLVLICK